MLTDGPSHDWLRHPDFQVLRHFRVLAAEACFKAVRIQRWHVPLRFPVPQDRYARGHKVLDLDPGAYKQLDVRSYPMLAFAKLTSWIQYLTTIAPVTPVLPREFSLVEERRHAVVRTHQESARQVVWERGRGSGLEPQTAAMQKH